MKKILPLLMFLTTITVSCSKSTDDLWDAVYTNDIEKARTAIDNGADVNSFRSGVSSGKSGRIIYVFTDTYTKYNLLMLAASGGKDEMIRLLVSRGADINLMDHEGKTAIFHAIYGNRPGTVKLLIELGAGHSTGTGGCPNISPVVQAAEIDYVECMKVLHGAGASLDPELECGPHPLLVAAEHGSLNAARYLLDCGADVNVNDNTGKTALILASREDHPEVVRLLLEQGARVDRCGQDGRTALFWAAALGRTEIARMLLARGADPRVSAWNGEGQSALGLARKNGHGEIVRLLISAGAIK